MNDVENNGPASKLSGMVLKNGWKIIEKIKLSKTDTGSAHSVCYNAEKDDQHYFLKAYDLNTYVKGSGDPEKMFSEMGRMMNQYKYEKELSEFCRDKGVTKVECIIDHGVISVADTIDPSDHTIVPYLIFERADGDVRKFMESVSNLDNAWKFKSLHDVAVGLEQLHRIKVYHQDVKPSNILTYKDNTKLGDLGRSVRNIDNCPFFSDKYWGDKAYLAPEVAYVSSIAKDERRMLLTDLYLLGSLITYYFFKTPFNGFLYNNIPSVRHYLSNELTYSEVLEELKEAHALTMECLSNGLNWKDKKAQEDLIELISHLCNPDIEHRHHPKIKIAKSNEGTIPLSILYGLERVISTLEHLHKRFQNKLRQ